MTFSQPKTPKNIKSFTSGIAIIKEISTLSNQIITMSFTVKGMDVARMQGIDAEKNKISETDIIATTNFVSRVAFAEIKTGRNISLMDRADAFAVKKASFAPKSFVKG